MLKAAESDMIILTVILASVTVVSLISLIGILFIDLREAFPPNNVQQRKHAYICYLSRRLNLINNGLYDEQYRCD